AEDWQFFQRESVRHELASALERLALGYSARGDFDAAIAYARRWLALDRLHEPAHCSLMRLYAWAGQRAAALHQYRECLQVLDHELGVPPLETTTELYEAIKENRPPAPPQLLVAPASGAAAAVAAAAAPKRSRSQQGQPDHSTRPAHPAAEDFPLLGSEAVGGELTSNYCLTGIAHYVDVQLAEIGNHTQ